MKINLSELSTPQKQAWLQHAIAPRPIAFASTIDKSGNVNLSPFSFFNLFSSNPPIVIFSPSRKGRDNTLKHTLLNVQEVPEVAINICDVDMVQQMSLSSCEYEKGVDEFVKSGFTKQASTIIQPPLVAEAKIKMECKVVEVKSLGNEGGAGQLVIAEVLVMHINDDILSHDKSMIDPKKIQHIARLGGDWYCKVNTDNLFTVPKPNTKLGIGVDALPSSIKNSKILSGNHLGMLGNVHEMPVYNPSFTDDTVKNIVQYYNLNQESLEEELHKYAAELLDKNQVEMAWQVLLMNEI
ncbi:MAG: flavin reductase family protein [Chitinophagaceae bacterium]